MSEKRHYGLDLLRILSMGYIVLLHYIGFGGISPEEHPMPYLYEVSGTLEVLTICAVNCFGLLSGYVGYKDQVRPHRIHSWLVLWMEVVFYQLLLFLLPAALEPTRENLKNCLKAFFPISSNAYWYFTAYTGLFFLMPLLNTAVSAWSRNSLIKLCFALFLLFSLTSFSADPFRLHNGYTFAWLLILYLFGAVLKKCGIPKQLTAARAFAAIALVWLLRTLWYLWGPSWTIFLFRIQRSIATSYTAPSTLLLALLHLIAFARLEIRSPALRKGISFAAPGAFAVYLLNLHPVIWDRLVLGQLTYLTEGTIGNLLVQLLGMTCLFVTAAILLDRLRQKLFAFLGIPRLCQGLVSTADRCLDRLLPARE